MNKLLTVAAVAVFFSGCSSLPSVSEMDPADRHQAAKTEYYNNLNRMDSLSAEQRGSELDMATIVAKVDLR